MAGTKILYATKLDANDATAKEELGVERKQGGKTYKYVQVIDLAVADGDVVEYASATLSYIVSKDRAGGTSIGRVVVGVAVGTITANYYGWILTRGIHSNMKTDGGVTAAQGLIPHATADGQADSVVAGTNDAQVFAHALADDDASSPSRVVAMVHAL